MLPLKKKRNQCLKNCGITAIRKIAETRLRIQAEKSVHFIVSHNMILCPHVITYILSSSVCLKGVPLITGSSWKPIGKRGKDTKKRTSWFTDIPYLRNPFLSYPRLKSGAGKFRTHLHLIRLINFQNIEWV